MTEPTCHVEMLGTLVSFPVCFASEGFCAVGECTAVRAFVTFLMFSVGNMDVRFVVRFIKRTYYLGRFEIIYLLHFTS